MAIKQISLIINLYPHRFDNNMSEYTSNNALHKSAVPPYALAHHLPVVVGHHSISLELPINEVPVVLVSVLVAEQPLPLAYVVLGFPDVQVARRVHDFDQTDRLAVFPGPEHHLPVLQLYHSRPGERSVLGQLLFYGDPLARLGLRGGQLLLGVRIFKGLPFEVVFIGRLGFIEGGLRVEELEIEGPNLRLFNNFEGETLIIDMRVAYWHFLIKICNEAIGLELEVDLGEPVVQLGLFLRIFPKLQELHLFLYDYIMQQSHPPFLPLPLFITPYSPLPPLPLHRPAGY